MKSIVKYLMVAVFSLVLFSCGNDSNDILDESISLNVSELVLQVGDVYQFKVSHNFSKEPILIWNLTGDDKAMTIATVDDNGLLVALEEGQTIVRVVDVLNATSYSDPRYTATCKVTILK